MPLVTLNAVLGATMLAVYAEPLHFWLCEKHKLELINELIDGLIGPQGVGKTTGLPIVTIT